MKGLDLQDTVCDVLNEMEKLAEKDLKEYLRENQIKLPRDRKDKILRTILKKTYGHYEATLETLKSILDLAWNSDEEIKKEKAENEEY